MPRNENEFHQKWETLRANILDIWPHEGGAERIVMFIQEIIDERNEYKRQLGVEREIDE